MNRESANGEHLKNDVFIYYYENSVEGEIYFHKECAMKKVMMKVKLYKGDGCIGH